jgi:hypothetical protein
MAQISILGTIATAASTATTTAIHGRIEIVAALFIALAGLGDKREETAHLFATAFRAYYIIGMLMAD